MVMITAIRKIKNLLEIRKSIELQTSLNFSFENSDKYKKLWKYVSDVCKIIVHLDETKVECIFNSVKLNLLFADIIQIYRDSNAFEPALDSFINAYGDGFVIDYYDNNKEFTNAVKNFTNSIVSDNEYDNQVSAIMKERYLSRCDINGVIIADRELYEILETKNFELLEKQESIIDIIYPLVNMSREYIFSDAANAFASIDITEITRDILFVYLETRWNLRFIIYNATKPQLPFKLTNTLEFQNKAILNSILHAKRNNMYSNDSIANIENITLRNYASKLSNEIHESKKYTGLSPESNADILYNVRLDDMDYTEKGEGVFGVNYPFIITDKCKFDHPFINKIIDTRNNDNVKYICIWYNYDDTLQLIKNPNGITVFNEINMIPNYKEAFDYLRFRNCNKKLIIPNPNEQFDCADPANKSTRINFDLTNISHIKHGNNKYIKASLFQDKLDEYFGYTGFTKTLPILMPYDEKLNNTDVNVLLTLHAHNLPSKDDVDIFVEHWK